MKLEKWKTPDNYFGDEWYDYYVGLSRHRDSDTLTESNFITFLQRLGGESKTVFIVRESHWAVGWIEWIAIHKDDKEALGLAEVMFDDINDYPVTINYYRHAVTLPFHPNLTSSEVDKVISLLEKYVG